MGHRQLQCVDRLYHQRAGRAIFNRPERLLPRKAFAGSIAFEVIAIGEAQELRVHVRQQLHDVLAQAVVAVVPRRRKKRNEAEPNRSGLIERDGESCLSRGRDVAGLERHLKLLPLGGEACNFSRVINRVVIVVHDRNRQRTGETGFLPRQL